MVKKIDSTDKVQTVIKTVATQSKKVNKVAVDKSYDLLDRFFSTAEKAQGVFAKTLEKGVQLLGVGQDRLLNKLEFLKDQYEKEELTLTDFLPFKTPEVAKESPAEALDQTIAKAKKAATAAAKQVATKKKATPKKSKTSGTTAAPKAAAPEATAPKATAPKKVAAKATTTKKVKDNLKTINGIGPKMESLLNAAGITTFVELANASQESLAAILEAAGPRYNLFDTSTWNAQALEAIAKASK